MTITIKIATAMNIKDTNISVFTSNCCVRVLVLFIASVFLYPACSKVSMSIAKKSFKAQYSQYYCCYYYDCYQDIPNGHRR